MMVYLSGPMTGYPDFNRPMFHQVKEWLTDQDNLDQQQIVGILSPADITQGEYDPGEPWAFYMRQAVSMLMEADVMVMLPGWARSKGALREFNLACELDMKIWELSMHTVPPGLDKWSIESGEPVLMELR